MAATENSSGRPLGNTLLWEERKDCYGKTKDGKERESRYEGPCSMVSPSYLLSLIYNLLLILTVIYLLEI